MKLFEQALAEEKKRLGGRMPALRLIGLRMSNLRDEKGGKQGGKLDGVSWSVQVTCVVRKVLNLMVCARVWQFIKRDPGGANRATSVARIIKCEEHSDITIDDSDDDNEPTLPLFSQEDDLLDLHTPLPSPPPDPLLQRNPSRPPPRAPASSPPPEPPSSDTLWAAFDVPLLSIAPYTHADQVEQDAFRKSGKLQAMQAVRENSGWGATQQVKRALDREAEERAELERGRETSGSPRKAQGGGGGGGREAVECPVCGKAFVGSEVALNAHVEGHFGGGLSAGKRQKKGHKAAASVEPPVKGSPGKGRGKGPGRKGEGNASGSGNGGKATLDGFWKR